MDERKAEDNTQFAGPAANGNNAGPAGPSPHPNSEESVQANTPTRIEHGFETQLIDEAALASGMREHFLVLMEEQRLLKNAGFVPTADASAKPILFFNQQRQLVHANQAALRLCSVDKLGAALGLRLGELLGCDHKMSDLPEEEHYTCQNCNCMPSLLAALDGKAGREMRRLVMNPDDNGEGQSYSISCIPISAGKCSFAMMTMENADFC